MADNIILNPGSGGATIATDEIDGVMWQRVKMCIGANGEAVDLSADAPMPVAPLKLTTAVVSNVPSSATSVTLLAANVIRHMATFFNDSLSVLYLSFDSPAAADSYTVQLAPGQYYEMPLPIFTGEVVGLWAAANGFVCVTELS